MTNIYLEYLQILRERMQEEIKFLDEHYREYDDGITRNGHDSRQFAVARVESIIEEFQDLKKIFENSSLSVIRKKFLPEKKYTS